MSKYLFAVCMEVAEWESEGIEDAEPNGESYLRIVADDAEQAIATAKKISPTFDAHKRIENPAPGDGKWERVTRNVKRWRVVDCEQIDRVDIVCMVADKKTAIVDLRTDPDVK